MADISFVTAKPIHHPSSPRPGIAITRVAASLAAMSALLGRAFGMAYVAPYTDVGVSSHVHRDDEVDGRNPGW